MSPGRATIALATTAVLTLAVLAPLGASATAAGCEWQPRTVRVVKHVKRGGKRVSLVRKRVRWSCVPGPTASPTPAAPAPTPAPVAASAAPPVPVPPALPAVPIAPPPPPAEEPGNPHWLGAQAYEFRFEPTGASFQLSAGAETIELINRGEDAHDLHLERIDDGAPMLAIGGVASGGHDRAKVNLAPGDYRLYCSFGDHAAWGMERTLVVVP